MATSRPSDYAMISPLCLRIAETMHEARIVVSDRLSGDVKQYR
jgi:hypothetical protein